MRTSEIEVGGIYHSESYAAKVEVVEAAGTVVRFRLLRYLSGAPAPTGEIETTPRDITGGWGESMEQLADSNARAVAICAALGLDADSSFTDARLSLRLTDEALDVLGRLTDADLCLVCGADIDEAGNDATAHHPDGREIVGWTCCDDHAQRWEARR